MEPIHDNKPRTTATSSYEGRLKTDNKAGITKKKKRKIINKILESKY